MKETHSVVYPFFCECVCVCGMETTPSSLQSIWRCLYFIFLVFIRSRWNPFDITWQMGNTWSLMCFVCFFPSWLDSSRPIYSFSSSFSFPPSFANVKWGLPLSLMSFWALYKSAIIWETGKRGQRRWEESTTCKRGKAFWCYCPTRLQRSRICLSKIKKKKKNRLAGILSRVDVIHSKIFCYVVFLYDSLKIGLFTYSLTFSLADSREKKWRGTFYSPFFFTLIKHIETHGIYKNLWAVVSDYPNIFFVLIFC